MCIQSNTLLNPIYSRYSTSIIPINQLDHWENFSFPEHNYWIVLKDFYYFSFQWNISSKMVHCWLFAMPISASRSENTYPSKEVYKEFSKKIFYRLNTTGTKKSNSYRYSLKYTDIKRILHRCLNQKMILTRYSIFIKKTISYYTYPRVYRLYWKSISLQHWDPWTLQRIVRFWVALLLFIYVDHRSL